MTASSFALLFDCDGVLADSMLHHTQIEEQSFRDLGIDLTAEEIGRRFAGYAFPEIVEILSKEWQVTFPENFFEEIIERKLKEFPHLIQPIAGIEGALRDLSDTPKAVASGSEARILDLTVRVIGLQSFFGQHVYSVDLVPRGKPAPDVYLYAARQLGVAPEACLVIEDGIPGVKAGLAAGMRVWGFTGGSHCNQAWKEELQTAGAELIFDKMADLPRLLRAREGAV